MWSSSQRSTWDAEFAPDREACGEDLLESQGGGCSCAPWNGELRRPVHQGAPARSSC